MKRLLVVALIACKHSSVVEPEKLMTAITVSVEQPGASSTTMADGVTTPLERQLGQIGPLVAMESHTRAGTTTILLEFANGTEVDQATALVQSAINAAAQLLPTTLPSPPTYAKAGRGGVVMRIALHGVALPALSEAADRMADKLAQVAGVGRVRVCGDQRSVIHVTVDPAWLGAHGRTLDDVIIALRDPALDADKLPALVTEVALVDRTPPVPTCAALVDGARVVAITVVAQPGVEQEPLRDRLEPVVQALTRELRPIVVEALPRTRPVAYELALPTDESWQRRIDAMQALINELRPTLHTFGELGATDPRVVDLRVIPSGDRAALDAAVQRSAALHGFEVHDLADHIIGLSGADPVVLAAQLETTLRALAAHSNLRVTPIGTDQTPTEAITVDRDKAAQLGIPSRSLDLTLLALGGAGSRVATQFTQLDQIPVILSVSRDNPAFLDDIHVVSVRTNIAVPLSLIATVTRTSTPTEIIHENQVPWLGIRVAGPVEAIEAVLATLPVPADLHRELRAVRN